MGRRLQRRVVAIAVLLLVLVPPPPPALSANLPLPPGTIFSSSLRTATTKILRALLKELTKQVLKDAFKKLSGDHLSSPSSGDQNKTGEPDERSANSAGSFIFNLAVGTPSPQNISGVLDITTELMWAQCAPCVECLPAPAPTFQPNRSATFARVHCASDTCQQRVLSQTCGPSNSAGDSCGYIAVYGDGTITTGHLAQDTFTFDHVAVRDMVFGCSGATAGNFSGVFGFSRGALSLVSQLQLSWFSYLWASDDDSSGTGTGTGSKIKFGGGTAPKPQSSHSTSFLTSSMYPDMYFVNLTGIRVDGEDLGAIPARTFDFQPDGSGGVVLSTTVPVTYLEQAAYDVVKKAIAAKITSAQPVNGSGSALGLDLCYMAESLEKVKVPQLALVFGGGDAVMDLRRYNYFFNDGDSGLDCLTILPSLGGSILGSLAQKGTNMTFDIAGQQLIFERAAASPAHSMASLTMMMLPYYLAVWAAMVF